jgi:hypothetical protein
MKISKNQVHQPNIWGHAACSVTLRQAVSCRQGNFAPKINLKYSETVGLLANAQRGLFPGFFGTYFSPLSETMTMKEDSNKNPKKSKNKKEKSLKERVKRHLRDKHDIITEQDLKDVEVGVEAADLNNPDEPTILNEDLLPNKIITSWDVVDEKD